MENYRAIPDGYMRIGEVAKKAGVTVRTLSYYDKEGLLAPSGSSEGGYRLYTDKDLAKLMQILMMKRLGFTLGEIKKRTAAMETAAEVLDVLTEHAYLTRKKIDHLSESLNALETLKEEIAKVDAVDFKKFANILAHLQMKNERYWIAKYLDDDVHDAIMMHNGTRSEENASRIVADVNGFIEEAVRLHDDGVSLESEQAKDFAERFWKWTMDVAGGDMSRVQRIAEQTARSTSDEKYDETMKKAFQFMKLSLGHYTSGGFIAEATKLHDEGVPPDSERGLDFAERYWGWLMKIFGGDMTKIQEMSEQFEKNVANADEITKKALLFMGASLDSYFKGLAMGGSKHEQQ